MKVAVSVITSERVRLQGFPLISELPDESSIARVLCEPSCSAVTVERWNDRSFRYVAVPV